MEKAHIDEEMWKVCKSEETRQITIAKSLELQTALWLMKSCWLKVLEAYTQQ